VAFRAQPDSVCVRDRREDSNLRISESEFAKTLSPGGGSGLISAALSIQLAMGYGMFAFTALGDSYFAYGALAGLYAAIVVGIVCVVLGDRTTTVYAPRVTTTFFLGALLHQLVHSDAEILRSGNLKLVILAFFAVIFLGDVFHGRRPGAISRPFRAERGTRSRPMISLPRDQLEVHLHLAARCVALTDTDRIPGGWRGVETSAIPLCFGWRSSIFLVPKWVIGTGWSHVD
jgi:hypothetical protein